MDEQMAVDQGEAQVSDSPSQQEVLENDIANSVSDNVDQQEVEPKEESEEKLPFGEHPRWKKQVETNRQLSAELEELRKYKEASKGAMSTVEWMRKDPEGFGRWWASQQEAIAPKNEVAPEVKPTSVDDLVVSSLKQLDEVFEPEAAGPLKGILESMMKPILDELKRYRALADEYDTEKTTFAEQQRQAEAKAIADNRAELDLEFDRLAKEKGLIDDKGNYDNDVLEHIADSALARMYRLAKNPQMPTKEELAEAFKFTMDVKSKLDTKAKSEKVKVPPPSFSKNGQTNTGTRNTTMSSDELERKRLEDIASAI